MQTVATKTAAAEPWLRFCCHERIGGLAVDHDFSLAQPWTCIFGPSGSGKSTLLRLIAGLTPQHHGECLIFGRDLSKAPAHLRRVALVEQAPALFPHRNVEANVAFSRRSSPLDGNTGSASSLLDHLLDDFQLRSLRKSRTQTLSGGERQRVAIARALYSSPQVLLLDEVFTGMDAGLREDLITALQRHQQRTRMPILSVTHDVAEAFATAGEVLRIHNGRVVSQGPPPVVLAAERSRLMESLAAAGTGEGISTDFRT